MKTRNSKNCYAILLYLFIPFSLIAQEDIVVAGKTINEHTLRAHIQFLADDLLGGRAPGTTGSVLAQKYIASQMKLIGLAPGFENKSYYQEFDVMETDILPVMNLTVAGKEKELQLQYYENFIAFPGVKKEDIQIKDVELVFVGYGIQAPEYDWDDFKNVDVRGKVLLILNNDPDHGDADFFGGKARLYYGRWDYKYQQAAKMGASGAIIIHTTPSAGYPWKVVQTSWSGKQFELPQIKESPLTYKAWITEDAAYKITKIAGKNLDELRALAEKESFSPVPLGITVTGNISAQYRFFKAANVGGLLPGRDNELRQEVVVFTAHYDHLGIGKAIAGDSIYNGALDNAAGVASILTLAKTFTLLETPPSRSLLFLAVDGEESGLLGSQFYAENPTFPPGKIAANINIDGANIWGKTRDIALIGFGKSNIDALVKEIAKSQNRKVLPDQKPEQGSFYRSDQFNFAKIGVPAFYFDNGIDFVGRSKDWGEKTVTNWIETYYHQPCDEYSPDWDLSGHIQDLFLVFQVAVRLANDKKMPSWLPGDEFEAVRKKAIGNVKQ